MSSDHIALPLPTAMLPTTTLLSYLYHWSVLCLEYPSYDGRSQLCLWPLHKTDELSCLHWNMTLHWETHFPQNILKWTERCPPDLRDKQEIGLLSVCHDHYSFFFVAYLTHWLPSPLSSPYLFPSHFIIGWRLHQHHCLSLILSPPPTILIVIFTCLSVHVGYTSVPKSNAPQHHSLTLAHSCSPDGGALHWHCPTSDILFQHSKRKGQVWNFQARTGNYKKWCGRFERYQI